MNDASRLLEGDLTADELTALLARLPRDAALRDALSTQQLVADAVRGLHALDDGYSLRILQRLAAAREPGNS